MVRARFLVEGAGVCLQSPLGDLVTVWGRWEERDGGERTQQEALADRAGASWRGRSVVRGVAQAQTLLSGWEWNGSQPCQGAAELDFPRPMLGKMQGEAARRAGEPSRQGEEPPPEGLGGHDLLTQTDSRRPAGHVVGHHLYCQPSGIGGEAAGRHVFSPTPYLRSRMAFSISAWRRWSASSSSISPPRSVMKP